MASSTDRPNLQSARSRLSGFASLAVATVLSFSAGVGATLLYLQNINRDEVAFTVPLIEAEHGPTRVRPEGLDPNGQPLVAQTGRFNPTSTAYAMTSSASVSREESGSAEVVLSLAPQGVPSLPELVPPADAQIVEVGPYDRPNDAVLSAPRFRLQLASFRSSDAAHEELNRLNRVFARPLADSLLMVERTVQGERGTYYRVVADAYAERDQAGRVCAALIERRAPCQVMGTAMPAKPLVASGAEPARPQPEIAAAAARPAEEAAAAPVQMTDLKTEPPPATAATTSAGVRAQLGSLRSHEGASRELSRLSRLYADVLTRMELTISRIDLGERGTFYRILTGPFPSRAEAGALCQRLGSNQAGCVLIAPRANDA
jgi:cell division septation protein DedD